MHCAAAPVILELRGLLNTPGCIMSMIILWAWMCKYSQSIRNQAEAALCIRLTSPWPDLTDQYVAGHPVGVPGCQG